MVQVYLLHKRNILHHRRWYSSRDSGCVLRFSESIKFPKPRITSHAKYNCHLTISFFLPRTAYIQKSLEILTAIGINCRNLSQWIRGYYRFLSRRRQKSKRHKWFSISKVIYDCAGSRSWTKFRRSTIHWVLMHTHCMKKKAYNRKWKNSYLSLSLSLSIISQFGIIFLHFFMFFFSFCWLSLMRHPVNARTKGPEYPCANAML